MHDGEITVAARDGDSVQLFVSIPYLRGRLMPLGDSFSLHLSGVRSFEFSDYEEKKKTSSLADVAMRGIEILSTDSTVMPIKVATTQGFLMLDFDELEIRLDTGQVVSYQTVYAACQEYWDEWSSKTKNETRA
jgi:hypothetical protein